MKKINKLEIIISRDWTKNENGTVGSSGTHIEYIKAIATYSDGSTKEIKRDFANGEITDDYDARAAIMDVDKFGKLYYASSHSWNACSFWYDHVIYRVNDDAVVEDPTEEPAAEEPAADYPEDFEEVVEAAIIEEVEADLYSDLKGCTDCSRCRRNCEHQNAFRRLPRSSGGLGLCKNL